MGLSTSRKRPPRSDLRSMPKAPDAIVLCGGAGLRLREVTGDQPKAMARIGNRPFLDLLLNQLRRHGYKRAILAVGYRQDVIRSHFGDRAFDLQLVYSSESSPLGTGGALSNAADLVGSDVSLVMNGDSYIDVDLGAFLASHREWEPDASLVVAPADGRADCGNVCVTEDGKVASFDEKLRSSVMGYLNAGVYLLSTPMLYDIPSERQVSLERELFRRWLAEGRSIRAFMCQGRCFDIGTPERYRNAQKGLAAAEIDAGVLPQGGSL